MLDAADNLALFKIIDSTGEVQINYPKLTELFVKGTGFNSKVVSLKGASMTLPNLEWYAAKGFSVDDAAKVVEDFSTIGVKTTITASQKGLSYLPSMIAGGKFSGKAVTTMGAIGLESGKINGLVIVDGIEGGALSAFEDGKIIIGTDKAFYFGDKASDSTFMNIIVDNALPHEIVHAKYADKIQLLSFADREAEDYLIDATLKAKLVGKDLTNYKLAETYLIKNYPYGTIMNYLYEVGKQKEEVATMARLYSEATDYLLASSKSVIESNYLNFLKAKYPKITLAQKNAKLTAFKNFAAQIKKTGLDYFNTGRWTAISEFIP